MLLRQEVKMQKVFHTKQFKAGNSAAVRIPANMAFPHHTNLIVRRKGNQIIVEPKEETLERIPALLAEIGQNHSKERPEFVEVERKW